MSQPPIPPIPQQTPPASPQGGDRTLMLVLSYLWILALVPLLVQKDDQEVQWHAKHGLVLWVAEIGLWIAWTIISMILGSVPIIGWVISAVGCGVWVLLWLGVLALHVVAIMKALKGERLRVPVVTDYADKWR